MLKRLSQPLFAVRFVSVGICAIAVCRLLCMMMLVQVVAMVTPHAGLDTVLDDLCKNYGLTSKALLLYIFIFSFLVSVGLVICGVFLFLRKSWARKMLILIVVVTLANQIVAAFLTGRLPMSFEAVFDLVFYICLLIFFTNRATVQLFAAEPAVCERTE